MTLYGRADAVDVVYVPPMSVNLPAADVQVLHVWTMSRQLNFNLFKETYLELRSIAVLTAIL
jgi:hypothetical protein